MEKEKEVETKIKKESNSQFFFSILCLIIVILMIIGISTATYTFTTENNKANTIDTGNISLLFTEDTNGIKITDAQPMTDATGKKLSGKGEYFDFTVKTTIKGKATTKYEISAEKDVNSTLKNEEVKLYLEKQVNGEYQQIMAPKIFTPLTNRTEIGSNVGTMLLASDTIKESTTTNYRLRMWINETTQPSEVQKSFAVQVIVNAQIET